MNTRQKMKVVALAEVALVSKHFLRLAQPSSHRNMQNRSPVFSVEGGMGEGWL